MVDIENEGKSFLAITVCKSAESDAMAIQEISTPIDIPGTADEGEFEDGD